MATERTSKVECRLTMDFPCPGGHNRSLSQFIVVSLSGVCGFSDRNIKIMSVVGKGPQNTVITFQMTGESPGDCWSMVSKLRRAVGDKLSHLNTIGHMKRVFNGSVLRVFDLDDNNKAGKVVRYQVRAPNILDIRTSPPRSTVGDIPRRSARPSTSSSQIELPPNSSHIPFDVLLIPSNVKTPSSPRRYVNISLPPTAPTSMGAFLQVDTRSLTELLELPKRTLPHALIHDTFYARAFLYTVMRPRGQRINYI